MLAEAEQFLKAETYPVVQLGTPFIDERGVIQNLTTSGSQSTAIIRSKAGSERASHIHRSDDHLAFVISGRIEYWWQDVELCDGAVLPQGQKRHVVVEAGQAFYTPPNVAHTMYFPEYTIFATVSCKSREHADHESDLIRVPSLKAR